MMKAKFFDGMIFTGVFLMIAPWPAYAYIDPGTGSGILQALIAIVIAIPFVLKSSWKKINGWAAKLLKRE